MRPQRPLIPFILLVCLCFGPADSGLLTWFRNLRRRGGQYPSTARAVPPPAVYGYLLFRGGGLGGSSTAEVATPADGVGWADGDDATDAELLECSLRLGYLLLCSRGGGGEDVTPRNETVGADDASASVDAVAASAQRFIKRWDRTADRTAAALSRRWSALASQIKRSKDEADEDTATTALERRRFLDRIALLASSLLRSEADAVVSRVTDHDDDFLGHDDEVTHQSDLRLPGREIFVVTTAALPWFTGTSVNPLLRAAHLCRMTWEINGNGIDTSLAGVGNNASLGGFHEGPETDNNVDHAASSLVGRGRWVTLVIPWLELEEDRMALYGPKHVFHSPSDQEDYIRAWMREEADLTEESDPNTGLRIM